MPDINLLPNTFKIEVKIATYKEATIAKEIQGFIGTTKIRGSNHSS